uniref:Matrix-remodelling associated 5a n=1 Tax=Cyprinus carpio TaxID=7962 RepID=A0A8C2DIY9_CYPCA
IVLQPRYSEVTAYLGETVRFECQSQGLPQPRITWVLPDRKMVHSSGPTHANPANVSVLSNGMLHMKSVSHMDRGIYKCIASNAAGADTISVRLTILALPPIIQQPRHENVTLPEGSTAYLNCTARGAPPPSIGWITPDGMQLLHRNGTLDIRSARMTDAGQLVCVARNEGGETRLVVQLDVTDILEKPKLKSPKMESLLLTVGRTINLNCSFDGSPTPQLTWILLNGSPLQSGAQFNKFLHKSDGTLVISNPALSEAGTYRCLGRNAAGMVERTRNGLEIRGKCFVRRVMKREFPLGELLHCHENVLQRNKTSGIQGGDSFLDCMFTTSTILVHYPSFGGTSHKNMMILTICINKGHQSYCTTICY